MVTPFGEFVRNIRGKDSLRTMAKKLEITPAFLSAIEIGKKAVPLDYVDRISKIYNLNEKQKEDLYICAVETNNNFNIKLDKLTEEQKEATLMFARKIEKANPELLKRLKEVLQEDYGERK